MISCLYYVNKTHREIQTKYQKQKKNNIQLIKSTLKLILLYYKNDQQVIKNTTWAERQNREHNCIQHNTHACRL